VNLLHEKEHPVKLILSLCLTLALTACGGGGDDHHDTTTSTDTPESQTEVPATAGASVGGLMSYLSVLVKAVVDGHEPLALNELALSVDEATEPAAVD
jgi:hypothetical protein